ncbi:hypothetical protein BFF78_00155 [Streptomyces fodineus]|uniref:Uncharacterized protein n=1 Tax=Streptomyces fodineus TaxID=1904616 RepID=A0A1D7Y2D0_9ACTN|nr:hypothetical protein [Streptomyces fodineus]AOR29716.1 hypothetical protein BFF78_00155 [Streptomyces fodineus]
MRPTTAVPAGPRRAELSAYLDRLRQGAQLTFAELAERTTALGVPAPAVSAATLKRAAGCLTVPKETTVVAFVRGCDATAEQERRALQLWRRARAEERGILPALRPPAIGNIRTRADFAAALAAEYEKAGAPALRTLQQRAGAAGDVFVLPLSTAWCIVRRGGHPSDWNQCAAFLRGCGVTGRRGLDEWQAAWHRVTTGRVRARFRAPDAWAGAKAMVHQHSRLTLKEIARLPHREVMVPVSASVARLLLQLPEKTRDHAVGVGILRMMEVEQRRNGTAPDTGINPGLARDIGWFAWGAELHSRIHAPITTRPDRPATQTDRQPRHRTPAAPKPV